MRNRHRRSGLYVVLATFAGVWSTLSACGMDRRGDSNKEDAPKTVVDEFSLDGSLDNREGLDEARRCNTIGNGAVSILHTWQTAESDPELRNVVLERWSPGSRFGQSTADHPNVGYSNRSGSVVNGSPGGEQPQALGCSDDEQLHIGWRFSNNVAGLTNRYTINKRIERTNSDTGVRTTIHTAGERIAVYADPATGDTAYYDESHEDGTGRSILTRSIAIGSAAEPNLVRIAKVGPTIDGAEPEASTIQVYTYGDRPIVETQVRRLVNGRSLTELTLGSGIYVAKFDRGAVVRTEVSNLVFKRDANAVSPYEGVCAPQSGQIAHTISKAWQDRPNLSITVAIAFDAQGSTRAYSCNDGLSAAECNEKGQAALAQFAPPACLY